MGIGYKVGVWAAAIAITAAQYYLAAYAITYLLTYNAT